MASSITPGLLAFCATWWTIPSTAIFTIRRWCAGDSFRSPFRRVVKVLRSRSACAANWSSSSALHTVHGSSNSEKPDSAYLREGLTLSAVVAGCIRRPAKKHLPGFFATVVEVEFQFEITGRNNTMRKNTHAVVIDSIDRKAALRLHELH